MQYTKKNNPAISHPVGKFAPHFSNFSLNEVVSTEELSRRPSRAPDHEAESKALVALATELSESPATILQKLVEQALALCGAGSAGISVLENAGDFFRWRAVAGEFSKYNNGTMPRNFSPCGVVLDRNATQLMSDPARYYPDILQITPVIHEVLLVPFYRGDTPIGTVWIVSHTPDKEFQSEDARLIASLCKFASAAVQVLSNLATIEETNKLLRDEAIERRRLQLHEERTIVEAIATAETNAKFRTFFEQGSYFAGIMSLDGTFIEANRLCLDFCGFSRDQVIGKKFWDCGWWNPSQKLMDLVKAGTAQAAAGQLFRCEMGYFFADGTERLVDLILAPVKDETGKVLFIAPTGTDITERKRLEEEHQRLLDAERAARTEAERVGRMKDEFLATLSHELRTPLNAILGWSQLLKRGGKNDEDFEQGIDAIERNARSQTQLIEDLLDMSRIISGKVRLNIQRTRLADVINAAVLAVSPAAQAKGVRLEKSIDSDDGLIFADPNRLQQVIWNLLSNALKFTPNGGGVQLVLRKIQSHYELNVIDSGRGIKPEFLPYVFERFRQEDASTTRMFGGLGLGLSIVKNLVELHGGSVRAQSPGEGQGATFTITLPVSTAPSSDSEEPEQTAGMRRADEGDLPDLTGIKVLVVDDENDAREIFGRMFSDSGATVLTAPLVADGLEILQRDRPHVIVSDIGMPGTDGYEFIRQVRKLPPENGGQTPALALTAFARAEDRQRALDAGFQIHIAKPVGPGELITICASLVGIPKTHPTPPQKAVTK